MATSILFDTEINNINYKIVGDGEFESTLERVAYITPVSGGAGAITVACLMKNTLGSLALVDEGKALIHYNRRDKEGQNVVKTDTVI